MSKQDRIRKFDHWVATHVMRYEPINRRVMGWWLRMAHWLGWHCLALHDSEGEVDGITFGDDEYVDKVVNAYEECYGEDDPDEETFTVEGGDGAA